MEPTRLQQGNPMHFMIFYGSNSFPRFVLQLENPKTANFQYMLTMAAR
jgi:hypothetical protein